MLIGTYIFVPLVLEIAPMGLCFLKRRLFSKLNFGIE